MNETKLKFQRGNAKLGKHTAIFSLPAGHTCPAAKVCYSHADKVTGKINDGKDTQFRCYAASAENLFTAVRKARWNNLELLQACKDDYAMAKLILESLPKKAKLVRIHASGDFFNQSYFNAWLMVAQLNPDVIFYAYTKMLPFWIKSLDFIPSNLRLVASEGGVFDHLIKQHNLRSVVVLDTQEKLDNNKLPIDHDDTHAWNYDGNFALIIHNTQPKGTPQAKLVDKLRKAGIGGYSAKYFGGKATKLKPNKTK